MDQVGKKNHASSVTNHHAFSYVCRCFMDQLSDAFEWWGTCRSLGDIVSRVSSNVLDRCDYSSQRYILHTCALQVSLLQCDDCISHYRRLIVFHIVKSTR